MPARARGCEKVNPSEYTGTTWQFVFYRGMPGFMRSDNALILQLNQIETGWND